MRGSATSDCVSLATRGTDMSDNKPKVKVSFRYRKHKVSKKTRSLIQRRKFKELVGKGIDPDEARALTRRKCIYAVVHEDNKAKAIILKPPRPPPKSKKQKKVEARMKAAKTAAAATSMLPVIIKPRPRSPLPIGIKENEILEKKAETVEPSAIDNTGIIMGIMHTKYPDIRLTHSDIETIINLILEEIVINGSGAPVKPKFSSIGFGDGFLEVTCVCRGTAEWLKRIERKLQPWRNAEIVVKEDTIYTPRKIVAGLFPYSQNYRDEKIFSLIDIQNFGIYSASWIVISKEPKDNESVKYTFSIDCECYKQLKQMKFKLHYKFGKVELKTVTDSYERTNIGETRFHRFTSYGIGDMVEAQELPTAEMQIPVVHAIPISPERYTERSARHSLVDSKGEGPCNTYNKLSMPEAELATDNFHDGTFGKVYNSKMMKIPDVSSYHSHQRYPDYSVKHTVLDHDSQIPESTSYESLSRRYLEMRQASIPSKLSELFSQPNDVGYESPSIGGTLYDTPSNTIDTPSSPFGYSGRSSSLINKYEHDSRYRSTHINLEESFDIVQNRSTARYRSPRHRRYPEISDRLTYSDYGSERNVRYRSTDQHNFSRHTTERKSRSPVQRLRRDFTSYNRTSPRKYEHKSRNNRY